MANQNNTTSNSLNSPSDINESNLSTESSSLQHTYSAVVAQSTLANTGNEKRDNNIFIDIEPSSKTNLLVTGTKKQQLQGDNDNLIAATDVDNVDHTTISFQNLSASSTATTSALDTQNFSTSHVRLTTANGSEVFLIGTAHFSHKSIQDVQEVMRTVKPSAVVLELCKERAFMLTLDEETLLEQNRKLSYDKVRSAIAEKGVAQGLVYIMFIKMSANLTEKLGMAPGSEFRAGASEAQKLPGCRVVLGDRSLKVTVARAVDSISLWQKIKLIYQVVLNDVAITQEDVEKCKDKDMLEQLLQELGGEYPGFKRVILDERNYYLAHSIYQWAENSATSKGPQRVVAIVGVGHVNGIVEHWGKTDDDQIRILNEIPTTTKTRRFVTRTIKYCSLALLLYVGYRAFIPTSIQNSISSKFTSIQ